MTEVPATVCGAGSVAENPFLGAMVPESRGERATILGVLVVGLALAASLVVVFWRQLGPGGAARRDRGSKAPPLPQAALKPDRSD